MPNKKFIPRGFLFDLDGTVYHSNVLIDGATDFFKLLNKNNIPYLFLTNRSTCAPGVIAKKLSSLGIRCIGKQVITSASCLPEIIKNDSVYCIGEAGLKSIIKSRANSTNPEWVVVGFDRKINYKKIKLASNYIRKGSKFIATNDDANITSRDGLLPENGAIVAAIENASSKKATIIGKPNSYMFKLACNKLQLPKTQLIMVGDNINTDIMGANKFGIKSALIMTGICRRSNKKEACNTPKIKPDYIIKNYSELRKFVD